MGARVKATVASAALIGSLVASVAQAGEPPAQMAGDFAAGSMRMTLSDRDRGGRVLGLKFGTRTGRHIELQYEPAEGQAYYVRVQVILPATPGLVPLSTEDTDFVAGIGYLDWAVTDGPRHPPKGCTAQWTERDGVVEGTIDCPKQGKGKKAFHFGATFVGEPVDAWRTCLPGFRLAAADGGPAASPEASPVPGPVASPPPTADPSPSAAWPAPERFWSAIAEPATCLPDAATGASPEPPIDACALVPVEVLAAAMGVEAASLTVDGAGTGRCRYLRADGYGIAILAGRGVNVTPPRPIAGAECYTDVPFGDEGVRGFSAGCSGPAFAWSINVAGTSTDASGVTVIAADPSLGGPVVENLLEAAVAALP